MLRSAILLCVFALTYLGSEATAQLPTPDYERLESDPEWLASAAQFHGHIGPWAAAGARLGMAGVRAVGAKGYFDVKVTYEGPFVKPPQSCFIDGLQVATGATLGKQNLHQADSQSDDIAVRITNTRTGDQVEVRPTGRLMQILGTLKPFRPGKDIDDHAVEALARDIVALPDREILVVTKVADAKRSVKSIQ